MVSLKKRIWALPAIAGVLFSISIGANLYFSAVTSHQLTQIGVTDYPAVDTLSKLTALHESLVEEFKNAVVEGDRSRLAQAQFKSKTILGILQQLELLKGQQTNAKTLTQQVSTYATAAQTATLALLDQKQDGLQARVAAMQTANETLKTQLAKSRTEALAGFETHLQASGARLQLALWTSIGLALFTLSGLLLASWLIIKGVWAQLGDEPEKVRQLVRAIARGDLSRPIPAQTTQSTSLLASVFQMTGSLSTIVTQVRQATVLMFNASTEIAAGNTNLSARTEQQASNLEETASAMEEMSVSIKQTAEAANQAAIQAEGAKVAALKGTQSVNTVVATMALIENAGRKISTINGILDSIAFQTNILALNAAVEAAHAGEHGRGFSVVATEVRVLAVKAADASSEIKKLILASNERVTEGRAAADVALTAMSGIEGNVQLVAEQLESISLATREQAQGVEQIHKAVTHLETVTQQNAALVEQSAAAAEDLKIQAHQLVTSVGVFQLAAQPA